MMPFLYHYLMPFYDSILVSFHVLFLYHSMMPFLYHYWCHSMILFLYQSMCHYCIFHFPFFYPSKSHSCSISFQYKKKNPSNTWFVFILPRNSRTLWKIKKFGFLLYLPCILHPSYSKFSSCIYLVSFIPPIPSSPVSTLYHSSLLFQVLLLYLPCIIHPSYSKFSGKFPTEMIKWNLDQSLTN